VKQTAEKMNDFFHSDNTAVKDYRKGECFMSENKKNKRKRRVLAASCLLAALIVGSSTFAWFTSVDEVTNKLSANNKYDVVAVEDFTPPTNWIPGQKVEKDVRTTNTGNIDAFVKVSITGDMLLTKLDTSVAVTASNKAAVMEKAIELSNTSEEIRSKMAGSRLVYKAGATTAAYGYNYNETAVQGTGVVIDLENSELVSIDSATGAVEFTPSSTGYYIFARSTTESSTTGVTTTVLYDGYYYDNTSGKYYDIEVTPDSENIYNISAKIKQQKTVVVSNDNFTYEWAKEKETDSADNVLRVTYAGDAGAEDDIIIDIKLANLSDWTKNLEDGNKTAAFYYNSILEAGAASSDVIDYVTLSKDVQKEAFITMDYNLKVTVNSAQVVNDGDIFTAVNSQAWANSAGKKKVTAVDSETKAVTWSDYSV